jgi:hypothetical protein
MQKIKVVALILALVLPGVLFAYTPKIYASPSVISDVYVSDDSGSTLALDDAIDPGTLLPWYPPTSWQPAVYAWGPTDGTGAFWNSYLHPSPEKAELLASGANWIWKPTGTAGILLPDSRTVYKVTNAEAVTGDVIKLQHMFTIPDNAYNIQGRLLIATDNAFYMFVNTNFTGVPLAQGNFFTGYDYSNFRDAVTGFPIEGSVELPSDPPFPWSTIHSIDVTSELATGLNTLEIVAINEYSTPSTPGTPEGNPAGVIYELKIQYELKVYLTVQTSPLGIATIPGEGWYENGTTVPLDAPNIVAVSPGIQYVFDYWDVDGTPLLGDPINVYMDMNHTATAHYFIQYWLTVISPYDTPGGSGWYNESETAYATLSYGIENITSQVRAVFTGWSANASGTGLTSDPILMDSPKIAVADWKAQYYLEVKTDPAGLNPAPLGTGWYDNCTYLNLIAPPVSYLNQTAYVFVYWDIDNTIYSSNDVIQVHMNMPHTVTAHYWLPHPIHLDAEPPRLIDLTAPIGTQWDELYPDYARHFEIQSWYDTNGDGGLTPSDYVDLGDTDNQSKMTPWFWHVDDITVTLLVSNISTGEMMYIEFEGGWNGYEYLIKSPTNANGTLWLEAYPNYGNEYQVVKWFDNCDSRLSYCDRLILWNTVTGEQAEYHIEAVKTDVIVSPQATEIFLYDIKNNVGKNSPIVITENINNFYGGTTEFTMEAFYDGLQPIGNQSITLNPLESGDAVVTWTDPASWSMGTYSFTITINTYANGTLLYSTVLSITFKITVVGDVNGDGVVNMMDIGMAGAAFGTEPGDPRWNPNADVNSIIHLWPDNRVNMLDIALIAHNFGNIDP